MPSLELQFYSALYALRQNYPNQVTTWGSCCNDYCNKPARGGGYCADCCEEQIAEIIDNKELALEIHNATTLTASLINRSLDKTK